VANTSVAQEQAGPQPTPPQQPPTPDFLTNALGVLRGFGQNVANRSLLPFPSVFNPTLGDLSPVSGEAAPNPDFYDQTVYGPGTYERPVSGGIARVMTSPLAQKIQPSQYQIDNPLFALGPAGDFAGPLEPAFAGAAANLRGLARGAQDITGGRLPNFLTETVGSAQLDLGAGNAAGSNARQALIDRQVVALKESGATDEQILAFMRAMSPTEAAAQTVARGQITSATGATVNAGKLTRSIQTALGHEAGGGMPETLKAFAPGGDKFAVEGRRHGGVIGAATRAVMANDPAVIEALGPELAQQLAQSKIAQLARSSGADESIIRQALQIMDGAAKTVAPEAKSIVADAVASRAPALSPEAEATVFAAEHKALTDAGLAATDEAMQAMRDRLIADARTAQLTATKSAQPSTGLLESLRQQGKTDGQIIDELRGVGLSTEDALAALRNNPEQGALFDTALTPKFAQPPGTPTPPAPPATPPAAPQDWAKVFTSSIGKFLDTIKQVQATLDVSQLMRQGLIPVVSAALSRNPQARIIARDAFVNAIKGYGDRYAGRVWSEVMQDPLFQKWKAAGGAERVIPAKSLEHLQTAATRTELFTGPLSSFGPTRAADRSFSLTLNALNFYRWKQGYEGIRAGGRLVTDAEQKALANWYNVASGGGNIGQNPILNRIFWAPRFVVSRVQTPYYMLKYAADPATREVGKIAAKDMAKTVVAGFTFMKAAELAGMKVGWDPTSTDFGKVSVGNTHIDPWGGFQQPAVLAARLFLDQYTSSSGKKSSLSEGGFGATSFGDLIQRFQESKYGVGPSLLMAWGSGKDFTGTPFGPRGGQTPEETAAALASGRAVPMSWADVVAAIKDDLENGTSTERGLPAGTLGAVAGVGSLLGFGASTYDTPTAYDGLGRDLKGPLPDEPVLDAWKAVRDGSAKSAKGTPTFSDLTAPDDTIGSGASQIVVTPEEHTRLAKLVGDARRAIIGQVTSDPKFASLGQGDKEKALADAKTKADNLGRTQFGIEVAKTATDDTARTRAVNIALNAASGDTGKTMDILTALNTQGTLTPQTKAAVDAQRTYSDPLAPKYELSVDEYLHGNDLVQRWVQAPAYNVGDPQTWLAAAHEATLLRAAYDALNREAAARGVSVYQLAGYKTYLAQYRTVKVGNYPIARFVDIDGTANEAAVSNQRDALTNDPLWSRFRAIAEKRDPYTPH